MSPNALIEILTAALAGLELLSQKHQACMPGRPFTDYVGKLRADNRQIKFLKSHHQTHLVQRGKETEPNSSNVPEQPGYVNKPGNT